MMNIQKDYYSPINVCTCLLVLWLAKHQTGTVTEESITVINNVGIQLSTRYLFAKPSIVFVPFSNIQNIVINEAIVMFQVRYYLAIVVKDSPKLLVVFQNILPNIDLLVIVRKRVLNIINRNE